MASWWAGRRKYHQTIAELCSFTDRELADIGINRWQIRRTAQASIAKRDIESCPRSLGGGGFCRGYRPKVNRTFTGAR